MKPIKKSLSELEKRRYVARRFDLASLLHLGKILHSDSPELQDLVKFGLKPCHIRNLGFGVPLATRGKNKGMPDPIRYANKILGLAGYQLTFVRREMNDRVVRNFYAIDHLEIDDDYFLGS
jgi:hypothetical protein